MTRNPSSLLKRTDTNRRYKLLLNRLDKSKLRVSPTDDLRIYNTVVEPVSTTTVKVRIPIKCDPSDQ